jgi:hypothetical protein
MSTERTITIFNSDGRRLYGRGPDLTFGKIYDHPHRAVARRARFAEVMQVWLLTEDALLDDVPPRALRDACNLIMTGMGLLMLGSEPDVVRTIHTMLLVTLSLAERGHMHLASAA